MHKLMEYICDEMEDLERKAAKDGKLSMAEVQYLDTLAHTKKNLLKADEMWEESEYSEAGGGSYGSYARGGRGGSSREGSGNSRAMRSGASYDGSYARGGRGRGARRDSMGRYSREEGYSMANEEMVEELRDLMQDAPDDQTRKEFQRFIQKLEQM